MELHAILFQVAFSTLAERSGSSYSGQTISETSTATSHCDRLVIYDSACAMCSKFIRFLDSVYRDSKYNVIVAPSVDSLIIHGLSLPPDAVAALSKAAEKSLILIKGSGFHTKSSAVIELLIDSNNPFITFVALSCKTVIPVRLADFAYDKIAKNRYIMSRLFPKTCSLTLRNIYQL